ncbi:hypothetical protein CHU94_17760 [Rhodoferax sp. TH121]|uniref:RidA family protein n=1 Tax=Rhodoferax sp. TH121 TaxID=2022803 RepID=UPI000B9673A2|nr:RidA family protein [Rhodoferax sp. TH121]OYQ39238.1 hypothetical protein CHU94_17760 [Rhodoferax sp. TH121]
MPLIRDKVAQIGLNLPEPANPVANFSAIRRDGDLLYISGQIGIEQGQATHSGALGPADVERGYEAARAAALRVLAHISTVSENSGSVQAVLKVTVFIAAIPEFRYHSQVANGASDLLVEVFGDAGRHARSAVGVSSLPLGAAVEVEALVRLAGEEA